MFLRYFIDENFNGNRCSFGEFVNFIFLLNYRDVKSDLLEINGE